MKKSNENTTKKIVWAGLLTALTTVSTMVIQVPSPTGGYINAGDALVVLTAFILGPFWGAMAAGLGSALSDILAGYVVYAPATFIIKGLMAFVACTLFKSGQGRAKLPMIILGCLAAETIMIAGYFLFTATLLGYGWGAAAEIPGNCIQGAFGLVCGTLLVRLCMEKRLSNLLPQ